MKIIIRKHGQFFREVDFSGSELVLGRSLEADIQLLHEDISRKHTKILRKGNKVTIEDMGSKNGTVFRGQAIQKAAVQEGEVFSLGPFTISVEATAPQSQRTVVEHSLDAEAPTGDFHENTGATNTSNTIRPDDFPSAMEDAEEENHDDSDSFLSAIAVSKKEKDDEADSIPTDPKMQDVIEYSKPTDPYRSIPEYLKEVEKRKKDSKPKKPTKKEELIPDEPEEEEGIYETQPTRPYSDLPEYLKEVKKREQDNKTEVVDPFDDPKTTPFESFSRQLDEEEQEKDEALIKTQVRQPESTMERSLKDFPSMTEDKEAPESEQFFLNREIDEEGIKETFENFPDTNKIKGSKDLESSFSLATEGEIEREEEAIPTDPFIRSTSDDNPSDAIPTESFSSPETEVGTPEEDQIKTFMINAKDLPDDLQSEKTDEFSEPKASKFAAILQKTAFIKPAVQKLLKDPKKKKIAFITSALLLGMFILLMMNGEGLFHREPVDPETAINSEEGFQKLRKSEKKRVVAFQIDQIQKLINNKQVEEADSRMKKLMTLATNDETFIKFEKEYQKQRDEIIAEEKRKQQEAADRVRKKEETMAEAKKMADNKQYDLAKKTYMRILETFPDDPEVQEKIQTIELLQEQDERKSFAKKQRYDMLSRIFTEGVQKYESGQLGQAQKLFKQVTGERGHPKYKQANDYLSRIDSSADKKINQKIASAKNMIQNPDTLLTGYNELKKIVSQFPLRSDAKKLLADAKIKMDKKAREIYADALAQEELAGDPAAALDLYKEVLKYAPDKSSKYNQKASEKISSLQL
jgi:hypothetical protein